MANHLTAPAYIDFFGLPGSGKSVLSHMVANEFVAEGYDVEEVSYDMDHNTNSFLRSIKKTLAFSLLLFSTPKVIYNISKVLRYNGLSPYNGLFFRHLINISYKINAYKGKRSLIMYDEGFCQVVLSISYNNTNFKEDSYQQIIDCIGKERKRINVFIKTSPKTALNRIKQRHDGQSRLDFLSDDAALEKLNRMVEVCEFLPQSVVVDNEEIEHCQNQVNLIVNFVKQQLETH